MLERKTDKQIEIEIFATNGRGYQTVPYTKLFGQKKALSQWLLFSNEIYFRLNNSDSDKTPFLGYIVYSLHDKIIGLREGLRVENYVLDLASKTR